MNLTRVAVLLLALAIPASPPQIVAQQETERIEQKIRAGEAFKLAESAEEKGIPPQGQVVRTGVEAQLEKLLVQDRNLIRARNKEGQTLLYVAAKVGNLHTVEILLKHGAAASESCGRDAKSPLVAALEHCIHCRARQGLQKIGDISGESPECRRYVKTVEALITAGADLKTPDRLGRTPLYTAAHAGAPVRIITLMISKGADVGKTAKNGETPLHAAAKSNWSDIVKLLLSRGADPNAKTVKGETSAELAADNGYTDLARFLLSEQQNTVRNQQPRVTTSVPVPQGASAASPQPKAGDANIHGTTSFTYETNGLPATITIDRVTYENIRWGTVTPYSVAIFHKSGIAKIPLERLTPELQKRFHYDSQKAAAYRAAESATDAQARVAAAERERKYQERKKAEAAWTERQREQSDREAQQKEQSEQQNRGRSEPVTKVKYAGVFNIKPRADGTYSANIVTEGDTVQLVIFEEAGLNYLRKHPRGVVYGTVREATVINQYGAQVSDTALYLRGSDVFQNISGQVSYHW